MRAFSRQPANRGLIDVHHHMIPREYRVALEKAGAGPTDLPDWEPTDSLAWMSQNGIEKALLSLPAPVVGFGSADEARGLARQCNEFGARLMNEHPKQFGALATLPLPDLEGSREELAYSLDPLGMNGVLLFTNVGGLYVGDPELDPIMADLHKREAQVLLHPNHVPEGSEGVALHPWAEFPLDVTRAYARMVYNDTLVRFPNIRWVFAHAGGGVPFLANRLGKAHYAKPGPGPKGGGLRWGRIIRDLALKRNRGLDLASKVSYETAGFDNEVVRAALGELVGSDRILYGSNFPWGPEVAA